MCRGSCGGRKAHPQHRPSGRTSDGAPGAPRSVRNEDLFTERTVVSPAWPAGPIAPAGLIRGAGFSVVPVAPGSDRSARLSGKGPAHVSGRLAGLDAELGRHGRDVVIDRLGRDRQGAGDLGVGLSFADQLEHLAFARGEPEWMRPGRPARAGRHRPGAYAAQLLAGEARRRLGA